MDKLWISDHTYIYDVGTEGKGEDFNGIDDMVEYAEVLELGIIIGGTPETGDDVSGTLASNTVTLQ